MSQYLHQQQKPTINSFFEPGRKNKGQKFWAEFAQDSNQVWEIYTELFGKIWVTKESYALFALSEGKQILSDPALCPNRKLPSGGEFIATLNAIVDSTISTYCAGEAPHSLDEALSLLGLVRIAPRVKFRKPGIVHNNPTTRTKVKK
jgi:hypothetical protein